MRVKADHPLPVDAIRRLEVQLADATRRAAEQESLVRAAKTLSGSLDLEAVLMRICQEAEAILAADTAAVYLCAPDDRLSIAAVHGLPPETLGYHIAPGAGLAGRVLEAGAPVLTRDYHRDCDVPPDSPFAAIRASLGVPIRWDGKVRGVLSLGYYRRSDLTTAMLAQLSEFAELAAVACTNASAHAGLAHTARTDGLTGCLNHAALHEALAREIGRARRQLGVPLSLVLLDLDDFKSVNEDHGHLVGDDVLRRTGQALRDGSRPYDLAARYGGDEFALLVTEAGEDETAEIARRAIDRLGHAMGPLEDVQIGRATAGVATWEPDLSPAELLARADEALLWGKQRDGRGDAVRWSSVPAAEGGRPPLSETGPHPSTTAEALAASLAPTLGWTRETEERLLKRTRQLALANAVGARLSAMTDADAIIDAAVDELHQAFGYFLVGAVRRGDDGRVYSVTGRGAALDGLALADWSQPDTVGLIGRCLREGRPVMSNDVRNDPEYECTNEIDAVVRSELIVPLWVGEELWGVIDVEADTRDAFDEDDVRLLATLAGQTGSALRSAYLYEQLESAYLGTAEALAAALEAKSAHTAEHARSIVEQCEAVGRRLGMAETELRDLRFGAAFHDIGKIAVPESILDKPGPLTAEERTVVERHTVVGEQILAPVAFLSGVRRLVRHEHERWDGGGYPDGLAGDAVPLGSRIILACDALHAMTTDRPYRRAMSLDEALAELRRNAGAQFDPVVVQTLLAMIAEAPNLAPSRS